MSNETPEVDLAEGVLSEHIQLLADEVGSIKHVKLATAIVSGNYESNTAAYMSVYPDASEESASSAVSALIRNHKVKKLIRAMRDESIMEGIMTRSEALKRLSDMAEVTMGDVGVFRDIDSVDDDGNPAVYGQFNFKGSAEMSNVALASIAEITFGDKSNKIKLHDAKAAIKMISDMEGWSKPKKVELSGSLKTIKTELTLEEATRLYEENLRQSDD